MNRTPLYKQHIGLGAKMVGFAGWEMPVMYSSIIEEHNAVRTAAGLFDVSHMGEVVVKGPNAADFLRRIIPTRLSKLSPGFSIYSVLPNEEGGVVDDLFIYMVSSEEYYLVVNAGTREKDISWMRKRLIKGVDINDLSAETAKIDIQGPCSGDILFKVINDERLPRLERFHCDTFSYRGADMMISQSGYTGEFGFELYCDNSQASALWNDLLEAGAAEGILPAGLGARDSLRLESCYSLYGHELTDDITPVEAGLSWLISSEADYIARNILTGQKSEGAPRQNIAFKVKGRGIPREGYRVQKDGADIGYVTSGGFSPTLKEGIGMALVKSGSARLGDPVDIEIRGKNVEAEVVKRPFYPYCGKA